jgi:hypothetical protein
MVLSGRPGRTGDNEGRLQNQMVACLLAVAMILVFIGGAMLTSEGSTPGGLGLIGIGCFWAVVARMRQAQNIHREHLAFFKTLAANSKTTDW